MGLQVTSIASQQHFSARGPAQTRTSCLLDRCVQTPELAVSQLLIARHLTLVPCRHCCCWATLCPISHHVGLVSQGRRPAGHCHWQYLVVNAPSTAPSSYRRPPCMPLGGGSAAVGSRCHGSQCGDPAAGASLSLTSAERFNASDRRRSARERPCRRRAAVQRIQAGCCHAVGVPLASTAKNAAMSASFSGEQRRFVNRRSRAVSAAIWSGESMLPTCGMTQLK